MMPGHQGQNKVYCEGTSASLINLYTKVYNCILSINNKDHTCVSVLFIIF